MRLVNKINTYYLQKNTIVQCLNISIYMVDTYLKNNDLDFRYVSLS